MSLQKRPFRYASASERSQRKGQWRPRWEGIQGNVILGEQREEQRLGGGAATQQGKKGYLLLFLLSVPTLRQTETWKRMPAMEGWRAVDVSMFTFADVCFL